MKTNNLSQFDSTFAKAKARFDAQSRDGLVCKQGFYKASAVLKLQKPSWTNDPMDQVENTSGIFFSIWMNKGSTSRNRAYYNIHALKLRDLKDYSIASREFARDFRREFASMHNEWPNVSVEYGPLTLMEGWIGITPNHLEEDVMLLIERFQSLSALIDRMLRLRRK